MPHLFDSHDQFAEWFSKDIEAQSKGQGKGSGKLLAGEHVERLHKVLKPFMLRRVKADVENELGLKVEVDIHCEMTYRQKTFYRKLKHNLHFKDLLNMREASKMESLMNLVMQLRKVCNHPELFQVSQARSPFTFKSQHHIPTEINTASNQLANIVPETPQILSGCSNPISLIMPKTVYDDIYTVSKRNRKLELLTPEYWKESYLGTGSTRLRSLTKIGLSPSELSHNTARSPLLSLLCLMHIIEKSQDANIARKGEIIHFNPFSTYSDNSLVLYNHRPMSLMTEKLKDGVYLPPLVKDTRE